MNSQKKQVHDTWFDAFADMCAKVAQYYLKIDKRRKGLMALSKDQAYSEEAREKSLLGACAYEIAIEELARTFGMEVIADGSLR